MILEMTANKKSRPGAVGRDCPLSSRLMSTHRVRRSLPIAYAHGSGRMILLREWLHRCELLAVVAIPVWRMTPFRPHAALAAH